ncbi:ceramide kinase isoform X2 [Chiloscyllium plagiosum]|uniref:ceramide kinase isoform X2 n=1 Tax=Chiloscyllium plagiosum TaxID=36176 RepID=UPI001CB83316|nr:ceramide kinase isoform X2 [Chiloscyllium plagiosum]
MTEARWMKEPRAGRRRTTGRIGGVRRCLFPDGGAEPVAPKSPPPARDTFQHLSDCRSPAMERPVPPPLLVSRLLVNEQSFEVTLTETVLCWQPLGPRKASTSGTVYHVQRSKEHHWECNEVTFHCSDHLLCNQWVKALKEQLDLQAMRPKHLIIFINPFGGKRLGKQIYDDKVAPLFQLACITADVIVTERANHARDHLIEADLEKYDGIVSVGGDGMFSEVMHGLISRTQKNSGIDENYPTAELVPCDLRIGIIPAGSTDCICYATVGTNDPITSALHIIIGDSQPIDVSSVHHKHMFLKYSVSLLGYGFYGDTLIDSEKNRWMGPSRYNFSGFKTFLSHHCYEGAVSFLPATETPGSPRDPKPCTAGCHICKYSGDQLKVSQKARKLKCIDEEQQQWKVVKGKFLAINSTNMSCACPKSPKGLSPAAHLADGTIDLILVHKCSRLNFLRHLIRHTNNDDQFDHAFVEVHRVKEFKFTPKYCDEEDTDIQDVGKNLFGQICRDHPSCSCAQHQSSWNCDGEIIKHAAIEVRVHCQLLKLFVRGIEK